MRKSEKTTFQWPKLRSFTPLYVPPTALMVFFSFLCKVAYQGMRPHALDRKRTAFSISLSYQLKLLSQWTHFTRKLNMQKLEPKVTSKYTFLYIITNQIYQLAG